MGGLQAGSVGFYQEQTSTRFVGLGVAPSSIAAGQVIGSTFIDFSCDCDFGDIDNDGDIDLIHSSYGSALSGTVPTRLFSNDGLGHFSEYNPSGFQLAGQQIAAGNPGIWCEGVQTSDTTDTTGANCDIAASPLDIDLGDIDGDLDLDILHGARNEVPRMYKNRIEEGGRYRDVTGGTFPASYSLGQGHYEQEMGDFDGDGDLDIYGLNWRVTGGSFTDSTFVNNGVGVYTGPTDMSGSTSDDNEADFFDYDCDGDLDVFIANFNPTADRVYVNNGAGTMTLGAGIIPTDAVISLDADCCDFDSDGDYDVIVAQDNNSNETVLVNGTAANDVTAANLQRLEQAPDRNPGAAPTVVRVQVYDNAPYYITWYNNVYLEVQVNAGPITQYPMHSSMGQIFRGEIPGNLDGTITYRAVSQDKYLNTSMTAFKQYESRFPGAAFCSNSSLGVDHTTSCPCGNTGAPANGCGHSFDANGANMSATGLVATDTVVLHSQFEPSTSFTLMMQHGNAGDGVFHDGVLCAANPLIRLRGRAAVGGECFFPNSLFANDVTTTLSARGGTFPGSGATMRYAGWFRNASTTFCPPATANVTNGWVITW